MTTNAHSTRARRALQALAERDPALGALSLWCQHRDGELTQTEGNTITYGPDFEALAPHEKEGLAAHHVLHVAFRHSSRLASLAARLGDQFDQDRWTLAADALINEALLAASHALPRPAVTLSTLLDKTGVEGGDPVALLAEWDVDRLYHTLGAGISEGPDGEEPSFRRDLEPCSGSGTGNPADPQEDAKWHQHLARAMAAGRQAGRGLGIFGHRIADIPAPQVPWERVLRRLLGRATLPLPQPNPSRPSRRWLAGAANASGLGTALPAFEPGTRPISELPRIVAALDASSSIDAARLARFWSEITGLARRLRAELHILIFDDDIRQRLLIRPGERSPAPPSLPRDGGTNFGPVLAEAERLQASALVILTDLEGPPCPAPRVPQVIWAVPDARARRAPFGTLLDLNH